MAHIQRSEDELAMSTPLDVTSSLDAANVNLGRKPYLLFRSCGESRQTARPGNVLLAGGAPPCLGRLAWAASSREEP